MFTVSYLPVYSALKKHLILKGCNLFPSPYFSKVKERISEITDINTVKGVSEQFRE